MFRLYWTQKYKNLPFNNLINVIYINKITFEMGLHLRKYYITIYPRTVIKF